MSNNEVLVQNSLPSHAPAFCGTPFWYMHGLEKRVKIGTQSFNYMDYLEGYCHFNCWTYRSRDALNDIRKKIQAAFDEIDNQEFRNSRQKIAAKRK